MIAAISFYASTMSRNTLQALAPAVLGVIASLMLLIGAGQVERTIGYPLCYLIGVPAMTLMLLALMYWNFKRVLIGGKVWRRNAIVLVTSLALVIGTTTAIYHRAWEFLMPREPAHGAARLSSSDPVKMQTFGNAISVQFPDGKIWSRLFTLSVPDLTTVLSGNWKIKPMFRDGKFLEETNWESVSVSYQGMLGIQKDGSLWASEKLREGFDKEPGKLVRLGSDNDWKAVTGHFWGAYFLKRDGTLWRWNTEPWNKKKPRPEIPALEIQRSGTNSDWAEISQMEWRTVFRKADGQTWISDSATSIDAKRIKLDERTTLSRAEYLDRLKSSARAMRRYRHHVAFQVGVRDDGKFVVSADFGFRTACLEEQGIQLGKESDWLAVAGDGETVVTLKSDGSLWKWNFPEDPIAKPDSASAVRLSKHSDWVAIGREFDGVVSLARDGTLWFWQFNTRNFAFENGLQPLLAASRKPQKIGNIFGEPRLP